MKKLKILKRIFNFVLCIVMVITVIQLVPQNIYAAIAEKGFIKVNAILIMKTENICMRTVLDVLAQTK